MRIAITATFTAEPIQEPLAHLLRAVDLPAEVEFAPYGQVLQQLVDPSSLLATNHDGVNVILLRIEDWARSAGGSYEAGDLTSEEARRTIEVGAREFVALAGAAAARGRAPHVVCLCRPAPAALAAPGADDFCRQVEVLVADGLRGVRGVHFTSWRDLDVLFPVDGYDDPVSNRLAHIPYTPEYFAALGAFVARRVYRLTSAPHKVIVLDCDQTIWTGVCGEVGALGVTVDGPRAALQSFMLEQHAAGMVLCLASKNNEEDALQVFDVHPDMLLRRDHVVSWRINWGPKSENVRALAAELQLGLDSFIFVDDDPVVCAEVRANCPEVLTLQLPQDPADIPRFLRHVWAFDHLEVTREDQVRSRLYKENAGRERLRREAGGFADFIASLDLQIRIEAMRPEHVARVSQLTQRTNQFNFTTIRRSEGDVRQLCGPGGAAGCLVVEVSDRFGDYGLVGVVIHRQSDDALVVDSLMLSCRALGRGVEHRMIARLGEIARARGLDRVECRLVPTAKNQPAREFLHTALGAYETLDELGPRYRVPTDVAAGLVFAPPRAEEDPAPVDVAAATPAVRVPGVATRNEGLNRIANELHAASPLAGELRAAARPPVVPEADVEPPRDEAERRLAAIWESVLGVRPIGRDGDFFALGGDSLLGVRLFSEIEAAFGQYLPLATLFEAPTVAALAERLRPAGAARWSALVPIQPNGARPPLYCVHAAGGHVLFYRDLARHLGPDQPLYGLQARGLDRTQTHHDRVEEMAAFYLEAVRAHQPSGPYYLGGSSFGGLVAFEMAQQLRAAGEEVALLALFDTYGPGYPRMQPGTSSLARLLHDTGSRIARVLDNLRAVEGGGARLAYLGGRVRKGGMMLKRKLLWKKNEFDRKFAETTGRELPKDLQRNHAAIQRALKSYVQKPYGGGMTLFRAASQPFGAIPDPTLGWGGVVRGGIDVHDVPGVHGAVTVDPYAAALAEKLTRCLERAHATGAVRAVDAHLPSPRHGAPTHV